MKTVYTVKDLQEILSIGKNTAYALIKSNAFPVVKIMDTYRIPIEPFEKWLNGNKNEAV